MTFNVFDRAFFGDSDQFDTKSSFTININEPTTSVSDVLTKGEFVSVKLVFNSRIKPTEDVSI